MMKLPTPRVEVCAKARLIETRAHALAGFARHISNIRDPTSVEAEKWAGYSQSLNALLMDITNDIETVISKAQHAM